MSEPDDERPPVLSRYDKVTDPRVLKRLERATEDHVTSAGDRAVEDHVTGMPWVFATPAGKKATKAKAVPKKKGVKELAEAIVAKIRKLPLWSLNQRKIHRPTIRAVDRADLQKQALATTQKQAEMRVKDFRASIPGLLFRKLRAKDAKVAERYPDPEDIKKRLTKEDSKWLVGQFKANLDKSIRESTGLEIGYYFETSNLILLASDLADDDVQLRLTTTVIHEFVHHLAHENWRFVMAVIAYLNLSNTHTLDEAVTEWNSARVFEELTSGAFDWRASGYLDFRRHAAKMETDLSQTVLDRAYFDGEIGFEHEDVGTDESKLLSLRFAGNKIWRVPDL